MWVCVCICMHLYVHMSLCVGRSIHGMCAGMGIGARACVRVFVFSTAHVSVRKER